MRERQLHRVGVFLLILMFLLSSCGKQDSTPEEYVIEMRDADEYFEENGEIKEIVDIKKSGIMLSESKLYKELKRRGFSDCKTTSSYDAKGNIIDEIDVSSKSNDKHPVYEVNYTSSNGVSWVIMIIGDCFVANPLSYNLQASVSVMVCYAEKDTITSYDSVSKQFYMTVPSESVLIVRHIDKITSEALDKLTMEEISG
jgi:hypothetical protein